MSNWQNEQVYLYTDKSPYWTVVQKQQENYTDNICESLTTSENDCKRKHNWDCAYKCSALAATAALTGAALTDCLYLDRQFNLI